jgi:DNA-binding response OmpR family regulator
MIRILVIDDDMNIREMLKECLEGAEYEVLVASDGKASLELQSANPVDLIITDIVMPEKEDLIRGLESGANDYISRPFHGPELRVRLRVGERVVQLQSAFAARVKDLEQAIA